MQFPSEAPVAIAWSYGSNSLPERRVALRSDPGLRRARSLAIIPDSIGFSAEAWPTVGPWTPFNQIPRRNSVA